MRERSRPERIEDRRGAVLLEHVDHLAEFGVGAVALAEGGQRRRELHVGLPHVTHRSALAALLD
jgi:hypothetical protein